MSSSLAQVKESTPIITEKHTHQLFNLSIFMETSSHIVSFLDDGRLHKAINVNNKMHIIEEMVLFRDAQPVQHIELDTEKVQYNEKTSPVCFAELSHSAN